MQNLASVMRVEKYKATYDEIMAKGGIYPANLCLDEQPLCEIGALELCRYQVNRALATGIDIPPPGRQPYEKRLERVVQAARARQARGGSRHG